jgi:hypothetical protein
MAAIRKLIESDIPAVVGLFERVYPQHRWASRAECQAYFREIFFASPWRDLDLPSWIAEQNGGIAGFVGVLPRPMTLRGRALRVAVGCQFMVDPGQRQSLVALQLAKSVLTGPQDLFIADGANREAQRLWLAAGGSAPLAYNLHWTRQLRPGRHALSLLAKRVALAPFALASRPAAALVDAVAARLPRNRFHSEDPGVTDEALDAPSMLPDLLGMLRGTVQPVYDARTLAWVLDQARRKMRHGLLRVRAVFKSGRRLIGWYAYYARAGAVNEVIQLAALEGEFDHVLRRLFADAWRHGATALHGRLDPRDLEPLSERRCWLRRDGTWTLTHSPHADLAAAIHQGEANLSRLEGEWWLRFLGG